MYPIHDNIKKKALMKEFGTNGIRGLNEVPSFIR